jgi:hypothetical protein
VTFGARINLTIYSTPAFLRFDHTMDVRSTREIDVHPILDRVAENNVIAKPQNYRGQLKRKPK